MIKISEPPLLSFRDDVAIEWPQHHVFLISSNRYFETIKDKYTAVLSDLEIRKANHYLRIEDFKSSIAGKYFLRKILSKLLNQTPKAIQFNLLENKKPGVTGVEFNVSRSADMIAVALSSTPIGVDIEFIQENFSYEMMLNDCFSMSEQHLIQSQNQPLTVFYTLWTRKEALLKASGKGLNSDYSLNQVGVLESDPLLHHERYYLLESSLISDQYMLSVARDSSSEKIHYWYI